VDREVNKRAIENLILAGACDSFDANRQQMSVVYTTMVDDVARRKKTGMSGQMSLFDLVSEEEKQDYAIRFPNLPEFSKEELLSYEKSVLGIYLSGHPLDEYLPKLKKNTTNNAVDFTREEESELVVKDGDQVIVGGLIAAIQTKFTKYNQQMAFVTLEDLTGSVEVIVFSRQYERYRELIENDAKVFIVGRAQVEEEKNGQIICDRIIPFDDMPKKIWLQFADKEAFRQQERLLCGILREHAGNDEVCVFLQQEKVYKSLGKRYEVHASSQLFAQLSEAVGEKNIKVVEKSIEKPV
jgi:DNA polymerase-3 subunit alpha